MRDAVVPPRDLNYYGSAPWYTYAVHPEPNSSPPSNATTYAYYTPHMSDPTLERRSLRPSAASSLNRVATQLGHSTHPQSHSTPPPPPSHISASPQIIELMDQASMLADYAVQSTNIARDNVNIKSAACTNVKCMQDACNVELNEVLHDIRRANDRIKYVQRMLTPDMQTQSTSVPSPPTRQPWFSWFRRK